VRPLKLSIGKVPADPQATPAHQPNISGASADEHHAGDGIEPEEPVGGDSPICVFHPEVEVRAVTVCPGQPFCDLLAAM
jgi:hypothetical protein